MICKNCNQEIDNKAEICHHCGVRVKDTPITEKAEYKKNRTALGFWTGFFIGLIGLFIGVCSYPEETISRKTFIKGWLSSLIIPAAFLFIAIAIAISRPY